MTPKPVRLEEAIGDFRAWVDFLAKQYGYENNKWAGCVWAWPPSFDLTIFESARSRVFTAPHSGKFWHRRNERDARTYCIAAEAIEKLEPAPKFGTHHNALDDAIGQAMLVQRAYRVLNARKLE